MKKLPQVLTICFATAIAGASVIHQESEEKYPLTVTSLSPLPSSISQVSVPQSLMPSRILDDPETKFAMLIGDVSELHNSFLLASAVDQPSISKCLEIGSILRHDTIKKLWNGLEDQSKVLVSQGILTQKEGDVIIIANGLKLVDVKEKVVSLGVQCIASYPKMMLGKLIVA